MTVSLDQPQMQQTRIVIRKRKRANAPAHFRQKPERLWITVVTIVLATTAIAGLALYLLLPTLSSGYNGDDARNSQIPMIMQTQHQNYFDLVGENIRNWAKASGRFFPLSIAETALVFLTFGTRWSYKVFQIGIVLADLGLLIGVVTTISRKVHIGLLAAFLAVLTFQLRQFFDPIMLFSGQQQIVVGLVLTSLWAGFSALHTNRKRATVLACITWAAAMLTYETTYLLLPVFLLLIAVYGKSKRARIVNTIAYALPTTILLIIDFVLRANANVKSPSYLTNFDMGPVSSTFARQFTSSIPLSYPGFGSNYYPTTWSTGPIATVLLLSALTFGVLFLTLRKVTMQRRDALVLLAVGVGMWALPSAVVAITKGWQDQVHWGAGYVSEYAGYFGFAITATVTLTTIAQLRRVLPAAISIALVAVLALGSGFLLGITKQNNLISIASWDPFRYPRDTFERSIQHGVFSGVLPNSSVVSLQPGIWVDPSVIQGNGGPKIRKLDPPYRNATLPDCASLNAQCFTTHDPQWVSNHTGSKDHNGVSIVARITSAQTSNSDRPTLFSNDFYLYVESPSLHNGTPPATVQTVRATRDSSESTTLNSTIATRIGNGDGWALWHFTGGPQVGVDRITVHVGGALAGALSSF